MARDFDGSTGYLVRTGAVLTATPITMACWFFPDDTTVGGDLMSITDIASINDGFRITYRGDLASPGKIVQAGVRAGGSEEDAISNTEIASSGWNHCAAVFALGNSRTMYLNGVAGTANTNTIDPTAGNLNRTAIGAYVSTSVFGPLNGKLAEAAMWNVALTAAEIVSLSKGFSPQLIRPASLRMYVPILGRYSPEIDLKSATGFTVTGTAPAADHCRVIYPRPRS